MKRILSYELMDVVERIAVQTVGWAAARKPKLQHDEDHDPVQNEPWKQEKANCICPRPESLPADRSGSTEATMFALGFLSWICIRRRDVAPIDLASSTGLG
jgi:hypothetical protein